MMPDSCLWAAARLHIMIGNVPARAMVGFIIKQHLNDPDAERAELTKAVEQLQELEAKRRAR